MEFHRNGRDMARYEPLDDNVEINGQTILAMVEGFTIL